MTSRSTSARRSSSASASLGRPTARARVNPPLWTLPVSSSSVCTSLYWEFCIRNREGDKEVQRLESTNVWDFEENTV